MAILSMAEIYAVAGRAGFTGRQRIIASAIAMAESSGNTNVVNYLGCVGLWQIYQRVHQPRYPHWTRSWLQNPNNNAQAAWILSNGGRNWRPWEVYCVPTEYKVLTRRGWVDHSEIIVNQDETIGYNRETGRNEWTTIREVSVFEDAEVESVECGAFRVEATAHHKWVVEESRRSGTSVVLKPQNEIRNQKDKVILAAPLDQDGHSSVTPDEAALIAWLVTDGSMVERHKNGKRLIFKPWTHQADDLGKAWIIQKKLPQRASIEALLGRLGIYWKRYDRKNGSGNGHYYLGVEDTRDLLSRVGVCGGSLLTWVMGLSDEARTAFFEAAVAAEGHGDRGARYVSQNPGEVLEALRFCIYAIGKYPSEYENGNVCRTLGMSKDRIGPPRRGERTRRTAVWCPTTDLGTWTAQGPGTSMFLTGNTNGMYRRHLTAAENVARTGGKSTTIVTTGNKWVNPLAGTITSGYGPRWGSFHSGTDIAPTAGQRRIGAAYAGKVIRTRSGSYKGDRRNGALTGRTGNGVVIDHSPFGQPYWTYYGHLSTPSVVVGQTVGAGQAIGIVGNTGNVVGANGTHLHFEVMNAGNPNNPFNPVPFMAARGANLGSGPSKAVYNPVYPDGILTPGQQLQASPWQFTFRFRLPSLANMKPVKIHPTQQGL